MLEFVKKNLGIDAIVAEAEANKKQDELVKAEVERLSGLPLTPGTSFLTEETDPIFSASPAAGITALNITAWNNAASNQGGYSVPTGGIPETDLAQAVLTKLNKTIPTKLSDLTDDLTGYVKTADINGMLTEDDLTSYAKTEDLADYAKTADLKINTWSHMTISDKGNLQLRNASEYAWKAKTDGVLDYNNVSHNKGEVILYKDWALGVEDLTPIINYYSNGGFYKVKIATVSSTGEALAKDATIDSATLTDTDRTFYNDTAKYYINALVANAPIASADQTAVGSATVAKKTKITYDKIADVTFYKNDTTSWEVNPIFEYTGYWEKDTANINIETAGNIKFQASNVEFLNVDAAGENTRIGNVSLLTDTVDFDANKVSITHKCTKNGDENGANTVFVYTRENNVVEKIKNDTSLTTKEDKVNALIANYFTAHNVTLSYEDAEELYDKYTSDAYAPTTVQATIEDIISAPSKLANKVDKVDGKGLSTEDFTTALKTKLEGLNNTSGGGSGITAAEVQEMIDDASSIQEKISDFGEFKVNGIVTQPSNGVVTLAPNATYTLTGFLKGHVKIKGTITSDTKVILNGVYITSDTTALIEYGSENCKKTLIVELYKDSKNYLITTGAEGAPGTVSTNISKSATLSSYNDMTVQGTGYLYISDLTGAHALKATELNIIGVPHIYVNVNHDAIHGVKYVMLGGGKIYINKAKDGFGTGEWEEYNESTDLIDTKKGYIEVYGGVVVADTIDLNIYESKDVNKGKFYVESNYATVGASISEPTKGMTEVTKSSFATGTVEQFSDETLTVSLGTVDKVDGVYTLSAAYVKVTGLIEGLLFWPASVVSNPMLILDGAYVEYNGNGPAIYRAYTSGNVSIKIEKNSGASYVKQTALISDGTSDYDAIKSEKNLKISPKSASGLFVSSKLGDGIDGSDVSFYNGSGLVYVNNCGTSGIKGTIIYIGANGKDGYEAGKEFSGAIYSDNNCQEGEGNPLEGVTGASTTGYADLYARNGKKYDNGVLNADADGAVGGAYVGSLGARLTITDSANEVNYKTLLCGTVTSGTVKYSEPYDTDSTLAYKHVKIEDTIAALIARIVTLEQALAINHPES